MQVVCFTFTIRLHIKTKWRTHTSLRVGKHIAVVHPVHVHTTELHLRVTINMFVHERKCWHMNWLLPTHCTAFNTCLLCEAGLGTILLLLYCTFLKHQYNMLQYSLPPIQYIAIFSTNNTIYCNILHQQYNILQYSPPPIQYIGKNILYYIVLYCIDIYCFKLITNHPHLHVHYLHSQKHFHWQNMQPTKDSIATVSCSETVVPPMSLVVDCNVMDRILAWPWRRVSQHHLM